MSRARPAGVRTVIALTLALAAGACVRGPLGLALPVVSPTGIVYEIGTPPTRTRFSQTAALLLSQGLAERALGIAAEGIAADSTNPVHYFLAGVSLSRLDEFERAHRMFTEAQRLFPGYELDIEPERAAAWVRLHNRGTEAYESGNFEEAIEAWELAMTVYDLAPETPRNLVNLFINETRYEDAIRASEQALAVLAKRPASRILGEEEMNSRAETVVATEAVLAQLFLASSRYGEAEPLLRQQLERDSTNRQVRGDLAVVLTGLGRTEEATRIYTTLLSEGEIGSTELFRLGIAFFRANDFARAGDVFGRLTQLRPDSRDVWFNYANALLGAEAWDSLWAIAPRLIELDPLGEKAGLIAARSLLETGDREGAERGLEEVEAAPVYVDLQMRPLGPVTRMQGVIVGNRAEDGAPVHLRFTFYDDAGPLGSETVTLAAPAPGERVNFEFTFRASATAYRYEAVPHVGG